MLTDLVLRGAPIREIAGRAADVQALGFDAVGVTETNGNPFLAAAQAAQATTRVRVMSAIALAFPRSPTSTIGTARRTRSVSTAQRSQVRAAACAAPIRRRRAGAPAASSAG